MWILDDAQNVAEGIEHRRDFNILADILNVAVPGRAEFQQSIQGSLRIRDSPVHLHASGTGRTCSVRVQAEFEATDIEADIERLIEVRLNAEHGSVPRLGLVDVWRVINRCSESQERRLCSAHSWVSLLLRRISFLSDGKSIRRA